MENENDTQNHSDEDLTAILNTFCESGFEGDAAKAALALGREEEQIANMLAGGEPVDEDLEMKIHGIAEERGIDLGQNSSLAQTA